jgi:signal transduction histidine kinase
VIEPMKATCHPSTFEKFSTNRLFDGIENRILKEIRPHLGVLRVRKDEVIYREGDRGHFLYLVGEGLVRISQLNRGGQSETLDYVKTGNFFGGRAMLEKKPYSAMAIAVEPSLLGTVKEKAFEKMLTIAPARLHMNFLRAVSEQLRSINSRFMSDVLQAERLRVVEAMASSILQDLKNPVSLARCCSDLIAAETGNAELHALNALLGKAVSGMVATTQELLDYTRGSISLKKQRVSIRRVLDELNPQAFRLLPGRNIELVKQIRYDGNIDVDIARFVRVLGHLVQNACDAMPNGGVLRFTTDLVQTEVVLRITDSGSGIRPELLSKLFQPFATNAESMGTGLSLAIAKAVIQAHGGKISIASVPDKGTTVDLRLPQPVED